MASTARSPPLPSPAQTTAPASETTTCDPLPTPIISSLPHNLQVRAYHPTDAPSCAYHANNRKIWVNMTDMYPYPYTLESAQSWMKHTLDTTLWIRDEFSPENAPLIQPNYAIIRNGECIGSIGLKPKKDIKRRGCEVGFWIGEEFWGRGYMVVVLKAFVEWVWRTFPALVRLDAEVIGWNKQSGRVFEKAGFVLEGVCRRSVFKDGRVVDEEIWALFREGV